MRGKLFLMGVMLAAAGVARAQSPVEPSAQSTPQSASPSIAQPSLQTTQKVLDLATRPGVTMRTLLIVPPSPRAALILLAGGNGGLQMGADGILRSKNFLVRSRELFAMQGMVVAVVDAPSDRQSPPFLAGFRQTPEHATDLGTLVSWLKSEYKLPVWLVGTSRGTQSAAYVALHSTGASLPDGVVLTSSILRDPKSNAVPEMALETLAMPVLAVHHRDDGCKLCHFNDTAALMRKLNPAARHELLAFSGGNNSGDPCEPMAYHGYNGIEAQVVTAIADWVAPRSSQ
jgi:hypothetical protein